jgi:hypothetical protein
MVGVTGGLLVLSLAPVAAAATGTQSFTTAGEHPFTVPAAVTSIDVVLVGGNGGAGNGGIAGGSPATVQGTIAVTPGQQLYVEVGGDGAPATQAGQGFGGYDGGGIGGNAVFLFAGAPSGGGGGGGSDLRTCSATALACNSLASRLIVAGGGGGGGGDGTPGSLAGGSGGAADTPPGGNPGQSDGPDDAGAGGGRATAMAGGPGGATAGFDGVLGIGGGGATSFTGGGAGGGGLYGGGGGGSGGAHPTGPTSIAASGSGGGGGGSSGVPTGAPGVSNYSLIPTDNGAEPHITFTWTLPPPAVVTDDATSVAATSATMHGTVNPDNSALSSCSFAVSPTPPAGATVSCAQQVPNGGTPVPVSAQLLGLKPSTTYTVTLSAANVAGLASGSPARFTTAMPVPPPVITKLHVAKRVHRLAGKHAKARKTIKLTLSEASKLTFTFAGKHGKRFRSVRGKLAVSGKAGADKITFGGLLGNKRLKLGSYKLTVVATNAAGGKSKPVHARFKLVR